MDKLENVNNESVATITELSVQKIYEWIENTENFFIQHPNSPFFSRGTQLMDRLRTENLDLVRWELEAKGYAELINKFMLSLKVSDCEELGNREQRARSKVLKLRISIGEKMRSAHKLVEQMKIPRSDNRKQGKNSYPIKYRDNTFTYGMKKVDRPMKGKMAIFCDYFYANCTTSGKIRLDETLKNLQKLIPSTTESDIRQWISDLNRWAKRPTNFGSQLGHEGKLLRVRDKMIERLK